MFRFLILVLLIFVGLVFLFGFSILRLLFGGLFGKRPGQNQQQTGQRNQNSNTQQNQQTSPSSEKKIFTSDDGEYVDYEEIKN
jgi:hypothetical protein